MGEDALEHYACCATARNFGRKFLSIEFSPQSTPVGNLATLGLNLETLSDKVILQRGLYTYALYRTMSALKYAGADDKEEVHDMLCQYARQGSDPDTDQCEVGEDVWDDTL